MNDWMNRRVYCDGNCNALPSRWTQFINYCFMKYNDDEVLGARELKQTMCNPQYRAEGEKCIQRLIQSPDGCVRGEFPDPNPTLPNNEAGWCINFDVICE